MIHDLHLYAIFLSCLCGSERDYYSDWRGAKFLSCLCGSEHVV